MVWVRWRNWHKFGVWLQISLQRQNTKEICKQNKNFDGYKQHAGVLVESILHWRGKKLEKSITAKKSRFKNFVISYNEILSSLCHRFFLSVYAFPSKPVLYVHIHKSGKSQWDFKLQDSAACGQKRAQYLATKCLKLHWVKITQKILGWGLDIQQYQHDKMYVWAHFNLFSHKRGLE